MFWGRDIDNRIASLEEKNKEYNDRLTLLESRSRQSKKKKTKKRHHTDTEYQTLQDEYDTLRKECDKLSLNNKSVML